MLKSQRGYSLVEVLVGVALIGGLALLITRFVSQGNPKSYSLRRACHSVALSTIDAIADESIYNQIRNFTPSPTDASITPAEAEVNVFTITEVVNTDLWDGAEDIVDGSAIPAILRNHLLIHGSLRALNAIYNSGTDYCNAFGTYPTLTWQNLNLTSELNRTDTDPIISIRLEPTDQNGAVQACAFPYTVIPPSGLTPAEQIDGTYADFDPSVENTGGGYKFTVSISYDYLNTNYACTTSKIFKYYPDASVPNPPDTVTVTINDSVPPLPGYLCTPPADDRNVAIQIAYTGVDMEPGTTLMCRDQSQKLIYGDGNVYGTGNTRACLPGDTTVNPLYLVRPHDSDVDEVLPVAPLDQWVPCHQVSICQGGAVPLGGAPSTDMIFNTADLQYEDQVDFAISFSNVPNDCIVGLEVRAIDTAGNISAADTFVQGNLTTGLYSDGMAGYYDPTDNRITHRAFCGTNTSSPDSDGVGVFCTYDPTNRLASSNPSITSHWWGAGNTDTPGNGGDGSGDWRNEFGANNPNYSSGTVGYYTCRPEGRCCRDPAGTTSCTPFN